nr:MAG TPA: hypothetical protein [Caudoviricetes sp.]
MKTKEQILKWLNEQPWKGEFYEASFFDHVNSITYDENFICGAFDWAKTKSGTSVWVKRDTEFRKWYNANDKPMSWEEYCRQNPIKDGDCYIDEMCAISAIADSRDRDEDSDVNTMPEHLCNAFLAYMKLIQLRNAWVKGCESFRENEARKITYTEARGFLSVLSIKTGLSFPTSTMTEEFINTFKDLLEVAKPLL